MAHRTLALGGRAAEPSPAMEGLLPAVGSTFQLILEHLWGALLVISESLRQVPALPAFPWEILVRTVVAVLVVLIVKRGQTLRSGTALDERCSAHDEVGGKRGDNIGPVSQDAEALEVPGGEASPLLLQTLCLSAINTNLSRFSLQDTVDFLEKARKSQPLKTSQATDAKPILKAPEKDGEQLQKTTTNDLNGNTHSPASPLVLCQDVSRWKERAQEKEKEKERLEQSNTRMQQILKDKVSQTLSVVADLLQTIPLPDLLGDQVDDRNGEVQQKREAGKGEHPVHGSEVDRKGVSDDADLGVPLQSPEEEHPERAGQSWEEKQMDEELLGQILSLQTEAASLQHENSKLESEIQQLKKKLQVLPDLQDDHIMQLHRKLFAEERVCSELDKELLSVCRDLNSTCQLRNLYKKMAEDVAEEVARCTSYYHKEKLFQKKRAEESWGAAVLAERKLKELRRENEHNRQRLAVYEARFKGPLPGGPLAPAAPPAAPRGPEVWGIPWASWPPQEGGGSCPEAAGTGAPLQV